MRRESNDQHKPANGGGKQIPSDVGIVSRWTEHLAGQYSANVGERLPPHSPNCAGCGPDNPAGLHMRVMRTEDGVEASHTFSSLQEGAPGIAHGGAVALAFDDLFGFALYTVGLLAVTRGLSIEYQAPFRLNRAYTFNARVVERNGRRLLLRAGAWDDTGRKTGSADATFIVVNPEHFVAKA